MVYERQRALLELLEQRGTVSVNRLAELLNVSTATIRSDLRRLESAGLVKRKHGGATAINPYPQSESTSFVRRSAQQRLHKDAIAEVALSFIQDHDSLIIDSSTTCLHLSQVLQRVRLHLTVLTNGIFSAQVLRENPLIRVFMIGGELRDENSVEGATGVAIFNHVHSTKAFLSAYGVDEEGRVTDFNLGEGELKRNMIRAAGRNFLLVDHTKFNIRSVSEFGRVDQFAAIITDDQLKPTIAHQYAGRTDIVLAPMAGSIERSKLGESSRSRPGPPPPSQAHYSGSAGLRGPKPS